MTDPTDRAGTPTRPRQIDGVRRSRSPTRSSASCIALRAIAREADGGQAISLLLLEISQVLLAGARLGAQLDFTPREEYQPDVGPEPDLDEMRLRLAVMLDGVDTYSFVFDPYVPELVAEPALRRPDLIATDLENGLRHYSSATSPRRCGGGSSPTSPPGATWPAPRSTRCCPWSPTTASTPTSRTTSRRSPSPMRCWTSRPSRPP